MFLISDCGQVYIIIESCIYYICHLGCLYILVLVFDYYHKVVNRERIIWNMLVGWVALLDSVLIYGSCT